MISMLVHPIINIGNKLENSSKEVEKEEEKKNEGNWRNFERLSVSSVNFFCLEKRF